MCHLRFDHWFRCNTIFEDDKIKFYQKGEKYPCSELWYETEYACADDVLDYLLEVGYYRRAAGQESKNFVNVDLMTTPSVFDEPGMKTNGRSYTY